MDAKKLFTTLENTWLKKDIEEAIKSFSLNQDYNIFHISGKTPLITAIRNRSFLFVKKLIECGADINLADKKGKTPLIHAYEDAQLSEITKFLILNKAHPNVYDNNILVRAVQAYDHQTVQLLIDNYPDIDLNSKIGSELPILIECCGYDDNITQILCLAAKDEKQIEMFREQLTEVVNPALLESKDNALKILDSISLELNLQKNLINKINIKKTKI
jgi:ankyrin repeat protein